MKRVILNLGDNENLLAQTQWLLKSGQWSGEKSILFQARDETWLHVLPEGWTAGDRFEIGANEWAYPGQLPSGKYAVIIRNEDGRYKGSSDEELVDWIDL